MRRARALRMTDATAERKPKKTPQEPAQAEAAIGFSNEKVRPRSGDYQ